MPDKDVHLEVVSISMSFGHLTALSNVDLELKKGEILGVIGPNGAGKTCLLNCISGFYKPQRGRILFKGVDLVKVAPHLIPKLGISRA